MKNIFGSTTFWALVTQLVIGINDPMVEVLTQKQLTAEQGWKILVSICVTYIGIIGRYSVGDVYTPKYLPGRNNIESEIKDKIGF